MKRRLLVGGTGPCFSPLSLYIYNVGEKRGGCCCQSILCVCVGKHFLSLYASFMGVPRDGLFFGENFFFAFLRWTILLFVFAAEATNIVDKACYYVRHK